MSFWLQIRRFSNFFHEKLKCFRFSLLILMVNNLTYSDCPLSRTPLSKVTDISRHGDIKYIYLIKNHDYYITIFENWSYYFCDLVRKNNILPILGITYEFNCKFQILTTFFYKKIKSSIFIILRLRLQHLGCIL